MRVESGKLSLSDRRRVMRLEAVLIADKRRILRRAIDSHLGFWQKEKGRK